MDVHPLEMVSMHSVLWGSLQPFEVILDVAIIFVSMHSVLWGSLQLGTTTLIRCR